MSKLNNFNTIALGLAGLPTLAHFIYEDPSNFFSKYSPFYTYTAWIIFFAVLSSSLYQLYFSFFDKNKTVCSNAIDIQSKMRAIIQESGNTCVVSRNLSWTKTLDIKSDLFAKASSGDLTVFTNEENTFIKQLKTRGATIHIYKGVIPKCRFTIKGYKSANPRLYIAQPDASDRHVIHKYSKKDDLTLNLAEDLVHILESMSK